MPEIIVNPNNVVIEGIQIARPSRMSVSQWMDYWERAAALPKPRV